MKIKVMLILLGIGLSWTGLLPAQEKDPGIKKAVAVLHPTEGNKVTGVIMFLQEEKGIRIQGEIKGLTPGLHGFHVHEFGDCTAPDATSAGAHFNPTEMPHAGPHASSRHAGDLGNVEAGADGVAKINMLDTMLTMAGKTAVVGRSLIVHAKADDLKSQPSGEAGGRVACGVIGIAKAE